MTHVERVTAGAPEVVVYGAATCEDTAITRSRLLALGVAFEEVDIDADPDGLARVIELEGRRVTPTVVIGAEGTGAGRIGAEGTVAGRIGAEGTVVAEPSIEDLERLIRAAGVRIESPVAELGLEPSAAERVRAALADGPIPLRAVPTADGGTFSLRPTSDGRAVVLFFAHEASCLACYGYAKQLGRQAGPMGGADAYAVIVSRDAPEAVRHWTDEVPAGATLLGDREGAWTRVVQAALSVAPETVVLLILDPDAAPQAVSGAPEAGGLVGPLAATELVAALARRP